MKTTVSTVLFLILAQISIGEDAIRYLEDIVELRKEILWRELAAIREDLKTSAEVEQLRIDLLNARIDVESEKGNNRNVLSLLSEIEEHQKRKLDQLKLLIEAGKGDFQVLAEQEISILQTKIRLTKLHTRENDAKKGDDAN